MFVRQKKITAETKQGRKVYTYYYLVKNVWEDGRTRQRDVAYLGKKPIITVSQIEACGLNRKELEGVKGLRIKAL